MFDLISSLFRPKAKAEKPSPLIYDGVLTEDERHWTIHTLEDYPFPIEVSQYPEHKWLEANLKRRTWQEYYDEWMANTWIDREGILFATISRAGGGGFLFLKDQEDYRAVVEGLPEIVVNERPFRTLLIN